METIKLTGQYSLGIEVENKRLRLIVFDGNEELVCHKASVPELNQFLLQDKAHLFKGRLQLNKTGSDVVVLMKGALIGLIPESALTSLLNQQTGSEILQ